MIVTRCGYGMRGCVPATPDERLQAYARALGGHYEPHQHARRAAAGLALLLKLRRYWKRDLPRLRRERLKTLRARITAAPKPSNVVPLKRRA